MKKSMYLLLATLVLLIPLVAVPASAGDTSEDIVPVTAKYLIGEEIVELRDQYSKTVVGGQGNVVTTISLGSIHYEASPGNFQPINTAIIPSPKPNWDWEVEAGHWQLYIKNDTTVQVKKGGNWVGHRLHGIAYLDINSKEYIILQTTVPGVTPTVSGNGIEWADILYGVDYRLYYKNDELKEDIVIKQELRDLLNSAGYLPTNFGLYAGYTYLVPIFECDWSRSLPMKFRDGTTTSPNQAETERAIYFESDIEDPYWKTKLVSFLPVGEAVSVNPINPYSPEEEWEYAVEPIRKRLIKKNDRNWLLVGVPVTKLNQMPEGSIIFDPSETLRPDASGDSTAYPTQFPGAGAHWDKVDEAVADDDTTYIRTEIEGWRLDLFNIPASTGNGTVNNIVLWFRIKQAANNPYSKGAIKSGGTTAYSSIKNPRGDTGGRYYKTYSHQWTTNPDDSQDWEWADIDDLQIGMAQYAAGGGFYSWCTQVYVVVDYNPITAPTVTTQVATSVGQTTAIGNGNITVTGGENCTVRGFQWGTSSGSYSTNVTEAGSFGTGAFIGSLTGLPSGVPIYYRAEAFNSEGWGYGSELTFGTIGVPTIATDPATYIQLTTARLNATLTFDGNEDCDVKFQYNTTDNFTNGGTANTTWVAGYSTGQHPYADITGLAQDTLYYFRALAKNTAGSDNTTSDNFTTASSINVPTDFKAFPDAERVVLSWTKGVGTTNTHIRYQEGSYSANISEGELVYVGSLGSYAHTGLTPGHSYYYSAWGVSGDNYTSSYATVMGTTLPTPTAGDTLPAPDMPSSWFGIPDYTKFSGIPLYPFINLCADAAGMPRASFWFLGALFACIFSGAVVFCITKDGRPAGITVAVTMAVGSLIELMPMFMMAFATVVFLGSWQLKKGAG